MSYRHLKSVLGETNLERKCRLLFGACLLLLVAGGFIWVWIPTENLVYEKDRATGSLLVDAIMLKVHWDIWEPDPLNKPLVREMSRDLQYQSYEWEFLSLTPSQWTKVPEDAWERHSLAKLQMEMQKQLEDHQKKLVRAQEEAEEKARAAGLAPESPNWKSFIDAQLQIQPLSPMYVERRIASDEQRGSQREYHYYQPVYWNGWQRSCHNCHSQQSEATAALGAAGAASLAKEDRPFHVVKVIMPDRSQGAIHQNRAILSATAIITVFVAMIALYVIVRYVIVKPLKHLTEVSDEISTGDTSLRAEINTNDEFADLATSFNRMVVHLTDAQADLEQANHALDAKVDELAQANMQLYDMNRLKSEFLANMSHELRTPLNSIIGFSDVLRGIDSLNDKQKRYVANIQKSGHLLLDMINDILDVAKMESGRMEVRPTEFSIATVVAAHCDGLRSLSEEKNIDLIVDIEPDLPPVYQDQTKVQQILMNLLSNAIKFTPEGGRIAVTVRRDQQGRLVMTVVDTGVGIAPEDREVIFEKFRQGSSALGGDMLTRAHPGTGLGLSIVRELAILLGGEVTLESDLGKGSTFTVRLPWACADTSRRDAELSARIDDLTAPRRIDLKRTQRSNGPPAVVGNPASTPSSSVESTRS
jgi:signal transduction histidine kinase